MDPDTNLPLFPALCLYPLNDSFRYKYIYLGDNKRVRIRRSDDPAEVSPRARTFPSESNGYFQTPVISGTHAEVWEENGKIYVRDLRSANGTYLNGDRLSASRVLSRAFELARDDVVAFGGDILDKETNILHHAIVAKVACILSPEDTRAPQVYARNAEIRLKNTLEEESRLSSTAQTGDSFLASPGDRQVSYQRYRSHTLRSLTDPVTTLPDDFPSFFGPSIIFQPLSDSFGGPKHISLPEHQRIEIGRENTSNPDTVASWSNGYFNQKSVSRQHAEVWEENGKIFIRDVGSSNGTVVNGVRLSAEGVASGPCELRTHDIVEFGTDIIGDDTNAIVHYKVPAMVECMYNSRNVISVSHPSSPTSPRGIDLPGDILSRLSTPPHQHALHMHSPCRDRRADLQNQMNHNHSVEPNYAENGSSTTRPASPSSLPPTAESVSIPALYCPKIPSWAGTGRDTTEHDTPPPEDEVHDKQEVEGQSTVLDDTVRHFPSTQLVSLVTSEEIDLLRVNQNVQESTNTSIIYLDEDISGNGDTFERTRKEVLEQLLLKLKELDLTEKIQEGRQWCGGGGYSDVFLGSDSHGTRVAIKRLRFFMQGEHIFNKRVTRELRIWSKLRHPNVLPLRGFVIERVENPFRLVPSLVTDWMENGSMAQYMLRKSVDINNLRMIEGILNGLCYLHSMGVVHGDMKAANILISPDGRPLLMDFGLSHLLISTSTMETATGATNGTIRWMAPELLDTTYDADAEDDGAVGSVEDDCETHTKQSDIWAFGMTALELLTKQFPFAKLKSDAKVMLSLQAKSIPSDPKGLDNWEVIDRKLWELCKMCWVFDPLERPDVSQLSDELKRIREESKGNFGVVVQVP